MAPVPPRIVGKVANPGQGPNTPGLGVIELSSGRSKITVLGPHPQTKDAPENPVLGRIQGLKWGPKLRALG